MMKIVSKQYNYKTLKNDYDAYKKALATNTIDSKTSYLAIAAGYALDFIDMAKDNKIALDISSRTEEGVPKVMVLVHFNNVKRGLDEKECRSDINKKLSAYEVFTIYNGLAAAGDPNVQIVTVLGDLVIRTKSSSGKDISFNVSEKIRKTLNTFQITAEGDASVFFGTMQPFYQALMTEFIEKL